MGNMFNGEKLNRIVLTLIPAVFFAVAIWYVATDKTPEVVHYHAVVRQGYESIPASYFVEASPAKKFADTWAKYWYLVLGGYVLAVAGTYFYSRYLQSEEKQGSPWVYAVFWVLGSILIFAAFVTISGDVRYNTTLTVEQYEMYKNILDTLFPEPVNR